MRHPPVLDQRPSRSDDEEAEYQAATARRHASEMVRNHLETHAANNPGASSDYVTWIATLHPENADITVDQRFFIPGNPWWTIYEDTKNQQQIPTATAVPVAQEADAESPHLQAQSHGPQSPYDRKQNGSSLDGTNVPPFWMACSPFNLFAGFLVSSQALLAVLLCESFALVLCHFPASFFYHSARAMSPPNICTGIPYSILMILFSCLALCDSIVLLLSVIVTEFLAITAFFVGTVTGGIIWGQYWHQQVRRMCHGIRIMFRRKVSGDPPRNFLFRNAQREDAIQQHHDVMDTQAVRVEVEHEGYMSPLGDVQVGAYSDTTDPRSNNKL